MRIFIPTSNRYVDTCAMTCKLLKKYWPDHPPADVCHFESVPEVDADVCLMPMGRQKDMSWAGEMAAYLQSGIDDGGDGLVLLCLDDYGLFKPVNTEAIKLGQAILATFPLICNFQLTWQPCDDFQLVGQVVTFGQWPWSFNTQAAIWRRTDLLRILESIPPKLSPWQTEQAGTRFFHEVMWPEGKRMAGWYIPRPDNASGLVDRTDKINWAWPCHNLVHRGLLDRRHKKFLQQEGLL